MPKRAASKGMPIEASPVVAGRALRGIGLRAAPAAAATRSPLKGVNAARFCDPSAPSPVPWVSSRTRMRGLASSAVEAADEDGECWARFQVCTPRGRSVPLASSSRHSHTAHSDR